MSEAGKRGALWAWEVVQHVGAIIGLLALLAAVSVAGVALHRPAWLVGGTVALCVLISLGEGAYRAWDAADQERARAEAELADAEGASNLADWLDERVREVRAMQGELEGLFPPSAQTHDRIELIASSLWDLSQRVVSRLRLAAPEWVDYFVTNPDWFDQDVMHLGDEDRKQLDRLLDYTVDQLVHVKEQAQA